MPYDVASVGLLRDNNEGLQVFLLRRMGASPVFNGVLLCH